MAASVSAQPQNLAGQWQGTLGDRLRLVFVLAPSGQGNQLGATMYSIDQTPQGVVATPTIQGGTVRLDIMAIGGSFAGLTGDADVRVPLADLSLIVSRHTDLVRSSCSIRPVRGHR